MSKLLAATIQQFAVLTMAGMVSTLAGNMLPRVGEVRGWTLGPDCISDIALKAMSSPVDLGAQQPQELAQIASELVQELPLGRQRDLAESLSQLLDGELTHTCKDEVTGGYVIRYPKGLGTEFVSETELVEFRIKLVTQGAPEIEFDVEKVSKDGRFLYSYGVYNNEVAKGAIWKWSLVANSADKSIVISHPKWRFPSARTLARKASTAPQAALFPNLQGPELRYRAPLGKWISWLTSPDEYPIGAGENSSSFIVMSDFRPGWTTAYVAGGRLLTGIPSAVGSVPRQVLNDLAILQRVENLYSVVLVIGPYFGHDATHIEIANNWHRGIESLLKHGWLSSRSPYVGELLRSLQTIAKSEMPVELNMEIRPKLGVEAHIDKIARLAF